MAPASDNNNQDLATKKAKLETNSTVLGGVGRFFSYIILFYIPKIISSYLCIEQYFDKDTF